jgi:hypothetical protein
MSAVDILSVAIIIWVIAIILGWICRWIAIIYVKIKDNNDRKKFRRWYNSLTDKEKKEVKNNPLMKDAYDDAFNH